MADASSVSRRSCVSSKTMRSCKREDLVERAVDLDVAQHGAGVDLDEPRGDADLRAEPLERARDDPARAEAAADLDGEPIVVRRLVRRVEVPQRIEDALAADYGEAGHVLQVRGHRLGDARPDPLVGRLARDVGESDDGDGVLRSAPPGPGCRCCATPELGRAVSSSSDRRRVRST